MASSSTIKAISKAELAERWYGFKQELLGQIQATVRSQKLSQDYIAARLGVDPAYVSRLVRGRQSLGMRAMHNLARAMNCRIRLILEPLSTIQPSNSGTLFNSKPPSATAGTPNTFSKEFA